jgi:DNA polymerase
MRVISIPPEFAAWRQIARECLQAGWLPGQLDLQDAAVAQAERLPLGDVGLPGGDAVALPHAPKSFIEAAEIVALHRDARRWNLLYRLLYRLQSERNLLAVEVDDDVAAMRKMEHQVRHDLHKMHAFVRFRKVAVPDSGEHYIAWYQPDHRVLRLAAPFFAERFAVMRWAILTPDASVTHDPETHELAFGAGVPREQAPDSDALEDLWRSYYSAIFNPARLNPQMMRSEMPVRYWRNLPEVAVLPELMKRAESRVTTMVTRQAEKTTAAPFVPAEHKLPVLVEAMPACKGCDLYKHATQVVPGAGSSHAHLMLVGEQPGNEEDKQGEPFVGPAGGVLRRAMDELHIKPAELYVTNAVKHFKFVQRGKLRLHQNPRMSEINACRPWLQAEIDAVKPRVILCLGSSAAKSLLGSTFSVMKQRGEILSSPYADHVIATVHPSAILRTREEQDHERLYRYLVDDLALAYSMAMGKR